jgi:hypothetical protein
MAEKRVVPTLHLRRKPRLSVERDRRRNRYFTGFIGLGRHIKKSYASVCGYQI